jgi:hypothetical protein
MTFFVLLGGLAPTDIDATQYLNEAKEKIGITKF